MLLITIPNRRVERLIAVSNKAMENLDKSDCEAKERLFYSAMLGAWLNTRLELDKQLLALSVTAIGLLITLLRTVGVSSFSQILLFGFALFAFLTTVISVIYILRENSEHIEKLLNSSEAESRFLTVLDRVAGISFVMGIVLTIIIGIHSAVINLSEKGAIMSQEQPKNFSIQTDSWNGVNKLRPQPPKKDSNNTTNELKPSKTSEGNDDSKSNN